MLAARGQGIGSAMTTVLGHYRGREMMEGDAAITSPGRSCA
jgi:hypothetical protein